MTAAALLCGCGQEVGPRAREFNAERTRIDRAAEARLGTRIVKPPMLPNGGYAVEPRTMDARGSTEREDPRTSAPSDEKAGPADTPDPATTSRTTIGRNGSKTAVAMRKREMDGILAQAEMRRRRTIAEQAARSEAEAKRRLAAVAKADAVRRTAFKPGDPATTPPSKGSLRAARPKKEAADSAAKSTTAAAKVDGDAEKRR